MEDQPAEQREPRINKEVVAEVVRCLVRPEPTNGDGGDANQSGWTSTEQDGCEHEAQEAPGYVYAP